MSKKPARLTHADRVFEHMKRQNRPLTAYEIFENLRQEGVTAVPTVYRALDKLRKAKKIHRIESLNAWTACCEPQHTAVPIFEICDDCGNVTEHVDEAIGHNIAVISTRSGFSPQHSVIEIHGHCSDCMTDIPTS